MNHAFWERGQIRSERVSIKNSLTTGENRNGNGRKKILNRLSLLNVPCQMLSEDR